MPSERQYGVTPPLSTQLPSEDQKQAADALLQELHSQGTFESAAETAKRYEVLASIQAIADAFVRQVAQEKEPDNPTLIKDARARVFTYGSFRLGVYGPGSDIDTLVVAPRYVTRVEYFKYFPDLLRKMSPPGAITELAAVEDAFVPIIKFEYSGISIDLIFSRIATLKQLPGEKDWNLKDSNLLRGLDEAELRSVNGTRVTDEIVDLVPEQKTFRDALRAVKLWAQRKAIYANIMGFPGGVAWAMMVARVCQLYPKATSAVIVSKFFGILLQWPWPNPVLLKNIESGPLQARVWNPKIYKGDGFHLMPIITPAYPSMCATFNITRSSMTVIQRELSLASDLCQKIMAGIRPWSALFTRHTFFTQDYKYYISVIASSTDKEAHVKWAGFVESKVRLLVQGLERHQSIVLARPFNKGYERTNMCASPEGVEEVKNGSLAYVVKKEEGEAIKAEATNGNGTQAKTEVKADSTSEAKTEVKPEVKTEDVPLNVKPEDGADAAVKLEDVQPQGTEVYTTTHYIGIELVEKAKSLDLSYQVNEFKDLCFAWELYRNELHKTCTVNIQHVRNFTLPDDVFEAGEVKPTKPVKKRNVPATAQAANAANSKKRTASEEQNNPPKRQQTTVAAG